MNFTLTMVDPPKTFSLQGKDVNGNNVDVPTGTTVVWSSSDPTNYPVVPSIDTLTAIGTAMAPGAYTVGAVLTLPDANTITATSASVTVNAAPIIGAIVT